MKKVQKGNEAWNAALRHFKKADPLLYAAARKVATQLADRKIPRRNADKLFAALCESVVSQQLATKAADAIWARVELACGGAVTPLSVAKTSPARLRKAGLSAAKVKTLKELAKAVAKGLDLPALRKRSRTEAEETLTAVWGIGPWTTEMFLLFSLGHPDIFSARDLGLIRSMESIYGFPKDSHRSVYEKHAECWAPHRSTASLILWRVRDTKA